MVSIRDESVAISHASESHTYRIPKIPEFTKSEVDKPSVPEYIEYVGISSAPTYTLSGDEAGRALNLMAGDMAPHAIPPLDTND